MSASKRAALVRARKTISNGKSVSEEKEVLMEEGWRKKMLVIFSASSEVK